MGKALPLLKAALLPLAIGLGATALRAQAPQVLGIVEDAATHLVLRVEGLTSGQRDAIVRDLRTGDGARLVYACVPAGILVFAPEGEGTAASKSAGAIDGVLPVAGRHLRREDVTETRMTLAEAEAACAQARDR